MAEPRFGTPIVKHATHRANPATSLAWIAAACTGIGLVLALLSATGHDQLWFLTGAARWLHGDLLYGPRVTDSNPPLIFWLSAIPQWLALHSAIAATHLFKLLQLAGLSAVYLLCRRILRDLYPHIATHVLNWGLAAFFALAFLCVPARDFGQREALLSWLAMPYLLCAVLPHAPRRWQIAAGLLGGLAFCIKPQQILVPLVVELTLLLATRLRRLRRAEPWLVLSGVLLYLTAIRLLVPQYFDNLRTLRLTYWAIGSLTFGQLLQQSFALQLFLGAAIVLYLLQKNRSRLAAIFLLAAFAADSAYLQQGTGWNYQQLPAYTFTLAALALLTAPALLRLLQSLPAASTYALAFLAALSTFLTLHFTGYPFTPARAYAFDSPPPALFQNLAPNTPVAILTTDVEEAMMPPARYHLTFAQRMNDLWWLPAVLRSQTSNPHHLTPANINYLNTLQHTAMSEDLAFWKPRLILIERCYDPQIVCHHLEDRHDNLLQWFSTSAAFRAAFAPYRFTGATGRFDVYQRQP